MALTAIAFVFPVVLPTAAVAGGADPGSQRRAPIIHTVEKNPDDERGVLKLARYDSSSSARSGDTVIVSVKFEELCNMPCGVPVDVSERPILFFVRDGSPVSHGFRIPRGADEFTITVKPSRTGMRMAGVLLTAMIVTFPIGIPLWAVAAPRAWIAEGAPDDNNESVRLKKARR
ncbi:MAG: hypothetical protein ACRBN8_29020 [Nannocystales bacterium]